MLTPRLKETVNLGRDVLRWDASGEPPVGSSALTGRSRGRWPRL